MPEPIPACFRGASAAPPPSTAAAPRLTTSSYHTHLGLAALSWSRTVLGLSLRIDLHLHPELVHLHVRPWLFWKRRGSKTIHKRHEVFWDLSHAKFSSSGGPEPLSGFFVAVVVDGEMVVAAGDMTEEAYKKSKAARPWTPPLLISRKEHVLLAAAAGTAREYKTIICDRLITIQIGSAKETFMSIIIDNNHVLNIKRLRWKFRGSERVELDGGDRLQISWDLHNWMFKPAKDESSPSIACDSDVAVFVFRFERELDGVGKKKMFDDGYCGKNGKGMYAGINLNGNWSETSSGGEKRRKHKSLVKTGSSSSSSSASSSSSSVMEWASVEEAELRSADGFSLVVYAWKS